MSNRADACGFKNKDLQKTCEEWTKLCDELPSMYEDGKLQTISTPDSNVIAAIYEDGCNNGFKTTDMESCYRAAKSISMERKRCGEGNGTIKLFRPSPEAEPVAKAPAAKESSAADNGITIITDASKIVEALSPIGNYKVAVVTEDKKAKAEEKLKKSGAKEKDKDPRIEFTKVIIIMTEKNDTDIYAALIELEVRTDDAMALINLETDAIQVLTLERSIPSDDKSGPKPEEKSRTEEKPKAGEKAGAEEPSHAEWTELEAANMESTLKGKKAVVIVAPKGMEAGAKAAIGNAENWKAYEKFFVVMTAKNNTDVYAELVALGLETESAMEVLVAEQAKTLELKDGKLAIIGK